MHALAERLLKTIRKQASIRAGDRLAVALSGGADSVALLCLLLDLRAELGVVLSVAHVNHHLRGEESAEDERFVAQLARQHDLELHLCQAPGEDAGKHRSSIGSGILSGIEAAAREQRYSFFRRLAQEQRVTKIATAHTLDDQSETVLLRMFRGTGIRGLAGIHPRIVFEERGRAFGEVVRPLLGFRRAALQDYLRARDQNWREDSSNRSVAFLRNRVRHRLLPAIAREFGESAIEHMAELAEIARAEEKHWQSGHPEIHLESSSAPRTCLPVAPLLALPLAAQRRLVRRWLELNISDLSVTFQMIEQALELAQASTNKGSTSKGSAARQLQLPCGATLRLRSQRINASRMNAPRLNGPRGEPSLALELEPGGSPDPAPDYDYVLAIPGAVNIPELAACIEARVMDVSSVPERQRGQLLDLSRMTKEIRIRNWRPGDRFWPAHTAAPKKVKELLSQRHAAGPDKKLWPVAVAEGCGLVWIRGFAVPAAFQPPAKASKAIWIRETNGMM